MFLVHPTLAEAEVDKAGAVLRDVMQLSYLCGKKMA